MVYYYKLSDEMSEKIVNALKDIEDYTNTVVDWLETHFNIADADDFITFNEIPRFTHSMITVNPVLKKLAKNNGELKKGLNDSKELIASWQEHKQEAGYLSNEEHSKFNYVMHLRRLFPTGAVSPVIDKVNKTIVVEVSEENESEHVSPITPLQYFEERVRLEKTKDE